MNKIFTLILLVSFASIVQSQNTIKAVGSNIHNFGTIYRGEKVKHVFEIQNISKSTIEIDKVETTCGCTAALISSKTLKPKQKAKITAEFNSESYTGPQDRVIYVKGKNNENLIDLRLQGEVAVEIDIVPQYLLFDEAVVGTQKSASVQILNKTNKPIRIAKIENNIKGLWTELSGNVIEPNKYITLKGNYIPSISGVIRGSVFLRTDAPHQKKVEIKFYSNVKDKI
ncbi:MAG: DUF1573 domain-containing protein [Ignavibacteria bacterium]|nr:DUF1573 domain-containing protein [Ignavibacteria bacterium]